MNGRTPLVRPLAALLLAAFCVITSPLEAEAAPTTPVMLSPSGRPLLARGKRRRKRRRKRAHTKKKKAPAPEASVESAPAKPVAAGKSDGSPSLRRSSAMEFDARLVQGERASGAVYLFQRVPRPLPGLVDLTRRYADRITVPVLHRVAAEPRRAKKGAKKGKAKR